MQSPDSPGWSEDSGAGAIVATNANGRPESSLGILSTMGRSGQQKLQETAILTAVRRQMEALEDKLTSQISRLQKQSDQSRDAHISRFDAKLGTIDTIGPKYDRKHAELGGSIKGLSDEMQAQIRRVDQMDSRLIDWRHNMEDEIRTKLSEMEQNFHQVSSSVRVAKATQDDVMKRYHGRLEQLEDNTHEHASHAEQFRRHREETEDCIRNLHGRLEISEASHNETRSLAIRDSASRDLAPVDNGASADLMALQSQFAETLQKCSELHEENVELRHRFETQEERFKALRTLVEAKDVDARLKDSISWDSRLKDVQSRVNALEQNHIVHAETFQQKLDGHQQELQEFQTHVRRLHDRGHSNAVVHHESPDTLVAVNNGSNSDLAQRVAELSKQVELVQCDAEFPQRITGLVSTLQEISPKVISQETALRQLQFKLNQIETSQIASKDQDGVRTNGSAWMSIMARVSRLETEVNRLVSEVEGNEDEDDNDEEDEEFGEAEENEHLPSAVLHQQRRASATE